MKTTRLSLDGLIALVGREGFEAVAATARAGSHETLRATIGATP